jgi:glycerophosphoryl diester phosphodiesterase
MEKVESPLTPEVGAARRVLCCHRSLLSGDCGANSLAAVRECVAAGVPRLEIDVRFLADDAVAVFHDETLDRETDGSGPISAHSRESLGSVRYRGCDEGITYLEDIAAAMRGSGTLLQVDLKPLLPITRAHAEALAHALQPVAGHALVGSAAHWNLRPLAALGLEVAFDPTLHWNAQAREGGDGRDPARRSHHGFWDDSPLAHLQGLSTQDYIVARIADLLALVPAVEWMVDWRTLFALDEAGCRLGEVLRGHGVALAAWTIKDEGHETTLAKMQRLFALGVETVITDHPRQLGSYLRGA